MVHPTHHTMPLEQLERATCNTVGHREVEDRRGAPVTEFQVCVRCGKIGERLSFIGASAGLRPPWAP